MGVSARYVITMVQYLQSNGKVKNAMKTCKNLMKKDKDSKQDMICLPAAKSVDEFTVNPSEFHGQFTLNSMWILYIPNTVVRWGEVGVRWG